MLFSLKNFRLLVPACDVWHDTGRDVQSEHWENSIVLVYWSGDCVLLCRFDISQVPEAKLTALEYYLCSEKCYSLVNFWHLLTVEMLWLEVMKRSVCLGTGVSASLGFWPSWDDPGCVSLTPWAARLCSFTAWNVHRASTCLSFSWLNLNAFSLHIIAD